MILEKWYKPTFFPMNPPKFGVFFLLRKLKALLTERNVNYRYRYVWLKLVTLSRFIKWLFGLAAVGLFLGGYISLSMPGRSYSGELPRLSLHEKKLLRELRDDVAVLAGAEIGERNLEKYGNLLAAAEYIEKALQEAKYQTRRQPYRVDGKWCYNIEAEITGSIKEKEIIIVGSHYDSAPGCSGANDNASGVAANLALARYFSGRKLTRTLRFVFFVNEEPPFTQTAQMGSAVYAERCARRKEKIIAMMNLESLGYFSEEPGSQQYPLPMNFFYPRTGNFAGFVGYASSKGLVQGIVGSFRSNTQFPSEGIIFPDSTEDWIMSDQWSFWQQGYPALTITDTAPFRYPHHHTAEDVPSRLNYEYMARLVAGLEVVLGEVARIID